jgi:hypothetical protein
VAVERGTEAHEKTVAELAKYLKAAGIAPLTAGPADPDFDLAWLSKEMLFVAEVKSLTDANEDKQLRLGLGQVLWYRHLLSGRVGTAHAVLVGERQPRDPRWAAVCESVGVALTWPGTFDVLTSA